MNCSLCHNHHYHTNIRHIHTPSSSYIHTIQDKTLLHFRGKRNREAIIRSLLLDGMSSAEEVVISGCSAGGLAIYLGLDAISNMINSANASIAVRGMSDSGFFMDYTSTEKGIVYTIYTIYTMHMTHAYHHIYYTTYTLLYTPIHFYTHSYIPLSPIYPYSRGDSYAIWKRRSIH